MLCSEARLRRLLLERREQDALDVGAPPPDVQQAPVCLPQFVERTPMLVITFTAFKAHGSIPRSDEAKRLGLRIAFDKHSGHIAVFISHRWWQAHSVQGFDAGCPDYTEGEKANLKWRVIVLGVEALIKRRSLDADKTVLWIDWTCIDQDDVDERGRGVQSLIHWTTQCAFMLIPTQHDASQWVGVMDTLAILSPGDLPDYGPRGWCRLEWFIFTLWAAIQGVDDLQLYAVNLVGDLNDYPEVYVGDENELPDRGILSVETDRSSIRDLQMQMIEAFANAVVDNLKRSRGWFDLGGKLLGDEHMMQVVRAVEELQPTALHIQGNPRITAAGYGQLFGCLATANSLKVLQVGVGSAHSDRRGRLRLGANAALGASGNFDAQVAAQLIAALKTQTGLETLVVSSTDTAGCAWHVELAAILATHATLETVDLEGTALTDEGALALAQALRPGVALRKLNVAGHRMTDVGLRALQTAADEAGVKLILEAEDGDCLLSSLFSLLAPAEDKTSEEERGGGRRGLENLERGLALKIRRTCGEDLDAAKAHTEIAMFHLQQDDADLDQALVHFRKSHEIKARVLGHEHQEVAKDCVMMGSLYRDQGNVAEAKEMFAQAHSICLRELGPDHSLTQTVVEEGADLLVIGD